MFEDTDDHIATRGEAYQELVRNMGQDRPDDAWILTDFDTWERNPYYQGPPVPHPEDIHDDVSQVETKQDVVPEYKFVLIVAAQCKNDIPF